MSVTARGWAAAGLVCCAAGVAGAGSSHRLVVALDVGAAEPPGYLCVIEKDSTCPGPSCEMFPLAELTSADVVWPPQDPAQEPAQAPKRSPTPARPREVAVDFHGNVDVKQRPAAPLVHAALGAMNRSSTADCLACRPTIAVHELPVDANGKPTGKISCGRNTAGGDHVAFVYLSFSAADSAASIQHIDLVGSVATIEFKEATSTSAYPVAQVIGGDYAPSLTSSYGTLERLQLTLHPRCTWLPAMLPANVDAAAVGDASFSLTDWDAPRTCRNRQSGDSLSIDVPYTPPGARATVTLASKIAPDQLTLEAQWADGVPAAIRMALVQFQFQWEPHCLSSDWGRDPVGDRTKQWSGACPRASIAGATCELGDGPGPGHPAELCTYKCKAPSVGVSLPLPVHFERMSWKEPIYAWDDTLNGPDQRLSSFAAPDARRLIVMLSPEDWTKDELVDELELVMPNGRSRTISLQPARAWNPIDTPGLTCSDSVSVHISGTHIYRRTPFDVAGGVVALSPPNNYRNVMHVAVLAGVGFAQAVDDSQAMLPHYLRPATTATLGGAVEFYTSHGNAVELEATSNTGRSSFVDRTSATTVAFSDIWYERWELHGGYEYWATHRLHIGGSIGGGIGLPLFYSDDGQFGAIREYGTIQVNARGGVGPQWLEAVLGLRFGELRDFYSFDADGIAHPESRRLWTVFAGVRYRLSLF